MKITTILTVLAAGAAGYFAYKAYVKANTANNFVRVSNIGTGVEGNPYTDYQPDQNGLIYL